MIRSERIAPELVWHVTPVIRGSRAAWVVYVNGELVMFAGVYYRSLCGEGEFWFSREAGFVSHKLEIIRYAPQLIAHVKTNFPVLGATVAPVNERFMRLVGYEPIGEWIDPEGEKWLRYKL